MYQIADEQCIPEILAFLETDLKNCLYSYIDIKKYGLSNPHLSLYYTKKNGRLTSTAMAYYNGLQLFCPGAAVSSGDMLDLIGQLKPAIISSTGHVIEQLSSSLISYQPEHGFVTGLSSLSHTFPGSRAVMASGADLPEISALICSDPGVGGHYTVSGLQEQLKARMEEGFGRSFVLRINGEIACHAATYAEVGNLAVISGVVTHPAYRGQGLALETVTRLCESLLSEGRTPYLFYYTKEAGRLYAKAGFAAPSPWSKLSIKHQ